MPRPWEVGAAGFARPLAVGTGPLISIFSQGEKRQRVPRQGPPSVPSQGEGGLRWGCRCGGGEATMRRSPGTG